jgi:hypothetical protein
MLELIRQPLRMMLMMLALLLLLLLTGFLVQVNVALAAALDKSGTVSYSTPPRSKPLAPKIRARRDGSKAMNMNDNLHQHDRSHPSTCGSLARG